MTVAVYTTISSNMYVGSFESSIIRNTKVVVTFENIVTQFFLDDICRHLDTSSYASKIYIYNLHIKKNTFLFAKTSHTMYQ